MKDMCKHNWIYLVPTASGSGIEDAEKRLDYGVALMLSRLGNIFYCPLCKRTAHEIKSHRGGMRLHHSNYCVERANKLLKEYGLPEKEGSPKFEQLT